ncbi:MAG: HDOD domain-containing protein [Candidatus Sedimenticola endophacoides]
MAKKIGDWATKLGLQPLPTMAPTAQRFRVLIDRVSGTNSAYQKVIEHDPGFTLAIFRLLGANTGLEEPIHSIAHAISLLGLDLVVEKIRHLPKLDELKPAAPVPGIYRCYSRAVHAAWYGALFGDMTGDNIPNEMAVAALFNECGEMTLWAHAQEEVERIEALIERGSGRDQAAREALGFTLDELSLALAKRWHLPPLTIEALQPFAAFKPRAVGARLAADLAQASDHDWNSGQTLECLDLVGEYLDLASGEAAALVHGQSAALAREIRELPLRLSAISQLQVPTGAPATRPARRDAPPARPVQPPAPRPAAPAPRPTTPPTP